MNVCHPHQWALRYDNTGNFQVSVYVYFYDLSMNALPETKKI